MKQALIIFVKYPIPGLVKTRMAKRIGFENSALAYKKMVEKVLENTRSLSYQQVIYFFPQDKKNDFENWLGKKEFVYQREGELGEKIKKSFRDSLKKYQKVVVIGSDCIDVNEDLIQEAFSKLDHYDVVIGPAIDGGYYLIGMKKYYPSLFNDISWSTEKVFKQTINNIKEKELTYSQLITLQDLDD